MRKKVVIIEGTISSGKTTVAKELGDHFGDNTLTLIEPDEKNAANPYLADYYANAERWSFTMQAHLLALRYRMHLTAQWHALSGTGHAVLDRSYFGDTAFAHLQVKLGLMSKREFDTYAALFHDMTASVMYPSVCIRMQVTPETSRRRIMSRMEKETGRRCEVGVSIEYLRGLNDEIEKVVDVLRAQGVAIVNVPWDDDLDTPEVRRPYIEGIAARIEALPVPDYFLEPMYKRAI